MKEIVKIMKRQATHWKKIFVKDISDKRLSSKIYKELLKLNNKETTTQFKNWPKIFTNISSEKKYSKHMKRCSTSYVIREIKIKTTVRYHYTLIRITKIVGQDILTFFSGTGDVVLICF